MITSVLFFFFSSRRRHTRLVSDWSSDVCSSDLTAQGEALGTLAWRRPDSDGPNDIFRLYEMAGAGHIDWWAYYGFPRMEDQVAAVGSAQGPPAWPFAARCEPEIPLMPLPVLAQVYNGTLTNRDQFGRKGTP